MIYLDYAATTPMDEEALEVYMGAAKEYFGNSESLHDAGGRAGNLLNMCRMELAGLLGLNPQSVIFTGGGTESNILAIHTLLSSLPFGQKTILTGSTEHSSIVNCLAGLDKESHRVLTLKHLEDGQVDVNYLENLLKDLPDAALIIVQHVNPETGCIQPVEAIKQLAGKNGLLFHVDAVQSFGKMDLTPVISAADSISISSHKIYGPKGTGALLFPKVLPPPFFSGVSHEHGYRPGTVNVPAIAAFVTAAKKAAEAQASQGEKFKELRAAFFSIMKEKYPGIRYEALEAGSQAPYILALTFRGIQGQYMMLELNRRGIAVSTGSACQIGNQAPSRTLMAMGRSAEEAKELIRISFGKHIKREHIDILCRSLSEIAFPMQQGLLSHEPNI